MNRSFSEDSRVKFPTIMHLTQMGYEYVSLNGVKKYDVPAVEFDPLTNILTKQFTDAFLSLNPDMEEADAVKKLKDIQDSLANDDLGREFFYKILQEPGVGRIIDLSTEENFRNNNTFQVATEMTCGDKSSDNFRPDITVDVFRKIAEARKTTMGHITQDHLKQSIIAVPKDKTILEKFESLVKPLMDKQVTLTEEITSLKSIRDFLLPMLMTGQLSIS